MPLILWKLAVSVLVAGAAVLVHHHHDKNQQHHQQQEPRRRPPNFQSGRMNRFLMRFFRDVGRHKARKRRQQNQDALVVVDINSPSLWATLWEPDKDDPLQDLQYSNNGDFRTSDGSDLPTFTRDELYEMGGGDLGLEDEDGSENGGRLLIAVLGRVYDVTQGQKFYGPRGKYPQFAGHDVTYALGTGCSRQECVETIALVENADGDDNNNRQPPQDDDDDNDYNRMPLSDQEFKEAQRWLSFFHLHDKYPWVGNLDQDDSFGRLIEELLASTTATSNDTNDENDANGQDAPLRAPILN